MAKKNKRRDQETQPPQLNSNNGHNSDDDSHKLKKNKKEKKNKEKEEDEVKHIPTVSIAVPASIIDNVPTFELATRLAGQIARAATIFRINEGLLPPLDAPHHLRKHEWGPYREGVTIKEGGSNPVATLVDVGLFKHVVVDQKLEPGRRVTVAMGANRNLDSDLPRQVVSSSKPVEEGAYWGYQVRYAHNISSVFKDCSYKGGYDYIIGTSEHGQIIKSCDLEIPSFSRHLLIAFGGLAGLEESIEEDDNLKGKNAGDVFNLYLNTCPHQGSRTIRTEEAIFISLQYFQEPISRALQS